MSETQQIGRLVCAQCCVASSAGATGWRGVLAVGDEDVEDDPTFDEVASFCPSCAEREFD